MLQSAQKVTDENDRDTGMFRRSLNNVEAERDKALRMIATLEKH
ncbi:hypothetical protein [Paraburkholderia sp. 31.1]|nr:hypothetical protein [Paraburkholderia sp. 31.1]